MSELLASQQWDFVVLNDYTQAPARPEKAAATEEALREHYAPLFLGSPQSKPMVPILIQTPAYRVRGLKDSDDLGDFDDIHGSFDGGIAVVRRLSERPGIAGRADRPRRGSLPVPPTDQRRTVEPIVRVG